MMNLLLVQTEQLAGFARPVKNNNEKEEEEYTPLVLLPRTRIHSIEEAMAVFLKPELFCSVFIEVKTLKPKFKLVHSP